MKNNINVTVRGFSIPEELVEQLAMMFLEADFEETIVMIELLADEGYIGAARSMATAFIKNNPMIIQRKCWTEFCTREYKWILNK